MNIQLPKSLLVIFVISFFLLLAAWVGLFRELSNEIRFGGLLGFIYGVLFCLHLNETWDPSRLQPVTSKEGSVFSKPIFITIMLFMGAVVIVLFSTVFQMESIEIYGTAGLVSIITLFVYALTLMAVNSNK